MGSNSEKCNKEMGNLIIQKRKEKHACMELRNNIFILFYFFGRTARAILGDYFLKARGFKTQRAHHLSNKQIHIFYSPNLQLYYYMLCSAGILFCFKQAEAEWKQSEREKKGLWQICSWLKLKTLSGYCCC